MSGLANSAASDGNWYYYTDDKIDTSFTGLAQNKSGWFYVEKGKVNFSFTGFAQNGKNWFWVEKGYVDQEHAGLYNDSAHGWWYVHNSQVDFSACKFVQNDQGWFWVDHGQVDFKHTGLYHDSSHGWWYAKNSKIDMSASKFVQYGKDWFWVDKGQVDLKHAGLYHDSAHGWWYVYNSKIDMSACKFVQNDQGWWWVDHGQVDMKHTGLYHDDTHGWWSVVNSIATNANVKNLTANHAEFEKAVASDFEATNASIKKLDADKLNATDANLKYANIDFSNIKIAAIENLYATSGIIKDIVVSDQRITGTLVGVTITGDLIEGNTVVADKLVIKGSDGLYYKLNTDGITTEAQQTDYNSLNGSIIKAKSITATKVDVTDLVAFGATIGGLKIENGSIHSVSKDSASNTTRGLFFGKDGQAAIGDGTNYLKYFKDSDGNYKLAISADTITIKGGQKNLNTELDEINKKVEKGKVVDEVNSELKIDGKSIALKTGHFTVDSKNLKLDSAGNATFSGKVKGAIVEASTFNGGTFNGNEFNGGSGWFHRGFAVKGNGGEGGEADFAIDSSGNGRFERNLTVFGKSDFRSNVDILETLSVTGAINSSNDISGMNVYGSNISLMKDKIDDTASAASAAKTSAANAQSTANAAKTAADNKPGWDTVNNKANSDTVKSVIRWRSQSRSLSLAANGEDYWNFTNLGNISGYTRTAMIVSISGSASSFMMQYQHTYNDNGTQIRCRNFATWAFSGSIYVAVLYVHDGYY